MIFAKYMYVCRLIILMYLLFGYSFLTHSQIKKYLSPELNYTSDIVSNFSGGDKRTTQLMGLVEVGLTFSSDSARLWKGGLFNVELISTHGKGITATTLHDMQGISNIEASNHPLLLWELWYHQQFGKLGIRGGFQNINSDFMNQTYAENFSCGSYGLFPTLALNYSLANYPVAGLGVSLSYKINRNWYLLTSLFNGRVSDLNHKNRLGTHWELNLKADGILSISELQFTSDSAKHLSSAYGIGLVFHNKDFPSVKDNGKSYKTNYTPYIFGQHDIYRTSSKNAGIFLQASYAPQSRNIAYAYTSIGFVMNGFFTSSHKDNVGIGLSQLYYQEVDDDILKKRLENTLETYFRYPLNKYITVQPTFYTIVSTSKTTITAGMVRLYFNLF